MGIYVACNAAAHPPSRAMGASPALAALAALRPPPDQRAHGAPAAAGALSAHGARHPPRHRARARRRRGVCPAALVRARRGLHARRRENLPVGAAWAAEAAYAVTRDALGVRVAKAKRDAVVADPRTRFAIGAASIGAVCAAMAPFRALPWIGAQVASRMIRSKVWWYGSFEALQAAAGRGLAGVRSAPRVLDRADGGRERERMVVSAGDAMRSARAVARVTARRPNKLREIPRIKPAH